MSESSLGWYEAFDWRWEDASCEPDGDIVRCTMSTRNKLTELTGREIPTTARFVVDGSSIASLDVSEDFHRSGYASMVFDPFQTWVATAYPTSHDPMWGMFGVEPADSDDRNEMLERLLDEFVAAGGPRPTTYAFLEATATADGDTINDLLAADATIGVLWATNADELAAQGDLLAAVGWNWGTTSCRVTDADRDGTTLTCVVRPSATWVDSGAELGSGTTEFRMSADGVSSVTTLGALGDDVSEALEPFWTWLRTNNPDEVTDLITERDGVTVPVLDPTTIERLVELIDGYAAETP
jgi:hypothetical protein